MLNNVINYYRKRMKAFKNEPLSEIIFYLNENLKNKMRNFIIEFEVLNPDFIDSSYSGKEIKIDSESYIYRGYKSWVDLASILFCKMLTPKYIDEKRVVIRFQKLNTSDSFHKELVEKEEKYGIESTFFKINKNEEPEILNTYSKALLNAKVETKKRVLNLGVNSGEEFDVIKTLVKDFDSFELVGIDYCESAISYAKEKFKDDKNIEFYAHDINDIDSLDLGEFDLIVSIGTLQSSNLNFNEVLMNIVQKYLKKDGSMILGFPNCRWIDGEVIYGAMVPNYPYSEMSLLFKDAMFCKKYLQQKKFRVTLTGKYYVFLTATSIRK